MWRIEGAISFLAEESGARSVTGLDVMDATPGFLAEHARRGSAIRFLQGDVHDGDVVRRVGPHDIVWCWGVLYHSPHPLLILERLRAITREILIIGTETMPEVPGLAQACVFFPGLDQNNRQAHAALRPGRPMAGLATPFDPEDSYGNWWWGITQSALEGMLMACGFRVLESHGGPLHMAVLAAPV
jgi:hypothetical protein